MKYTPRLPEIEAEQWPFKDVSKVNPAIVAGLKVAEGKLNDSSQKPIQNTDWVVLKDGIVSILSDAEFSRLYDKASAKL